MMREFFRGWRRKLGCVTLVTACVLTCGWIRSYEKIDVVNFYLGYNRELTCSSAEDSLVARFGWRHPDDAWGYFQWMDLIAENYRYSDPNSSCYRYEQPICTGEGDTIDWYLIGSGFAVGETTVADRGIRHQTFVIVPYWSIVLPLTLLSANLLLWKPRKCLPSPLP